MSAQQNSSSAPQCSNDESIRDVYILLGQLEHKLEAITPFLSQPSAHPLVNKIKKRMRRLQRKYIRSQRKRVENTDEEDELGSQMAQRSVDGSDSFADGDSNDDEPNRGDSNDDGIPDNHCEGSVDGSNTVIVRRTKGARTVKDAQIIVSGFMTPPASRTPLEFLFTWAGDRNSTKREFEGLKRIVTGYIPLDTQDTNYMRTKRLLVKKFKPQGYEADVQCNQWTSIDQTRNAAQKLIDLEVNLYETESQNIGWNVLSSILYRTQCIKVSKLVEEKSKGPGGQAWVTKFYKDVFEKKKGFHSYTAAEKENKWRDPGIQLEFEKDKKDNRWLTQSRNRLLKLYNLLGAAAILDQSFQPGRDNAGSKKFPYFMTFIQNSIPELDEDDGDSITLRSTHAREIILFIGGILGGETVNDYLQNFFDQHP